MFVSLFATKFAATIGNIVFGFLVSTGVVSGAIALPEFTSTGVASRTTVAVMDMPINAFATATGGNVKTNNHLAVAGAKYPAFCVPNPLTKLRPSLGSGAPLWLALDMGNNPSSVSYDIGFVKSCTSGTGTDIANNVLLATGATLTFSGSSLRPPVWNGADYIKGATLTAPNSATTARFRGGIRDVFGE